MRWLGNAPGRGIGAALIALAALCSGVRGDDTATTYGAWLGMTVRAQGHAWRLERDYASKGLKVSAVAPGGPADEAGIEPGDVVVSIDSHAMKEVGDLTAVERTLTPGRAVAVVLNRGGRTVMTFSMKPGVVPGSTPPAIISAAPGTGVAATGAAAGAAGAGGASDTSAGAGVSATGVGVVAGAGAVAGASGAGAAGGAGVAGVGVLAASTPASTSATPESGARAGGGAAPDAASGAGAAAGGGAVSDAGGAGGAIVLGTVAAAGVIAGAGGGNASATDTVPVPPHATPDSAAAATAAPADSTRADTSDIRRKGAAGLGVRCENLSLDLAAALGAKAGAGVLVLAVTTTSPADKAGIRPGDVISFAAEQPVSDVDHLDKIITTANSPLPIVTLRRGTTRVVSAEFPMPPDMHAAAAQDTSVSALRDEVRSLREEVKKLREEIAKGATVPHP